MREIEKESQRVGVWERECVKDREIEEKTDEGWNITYKTKGWLKEGLGRSKQSKNRKKQKRKQKRFY